MLVTMDAEQGVDLLEMIQPRVVVPIHYEEYGVMTSPLADFVGEVGRRRPASALTYLERGGTLAFG